MYLPVFNEFCFGQGIKQGRLHCFLRVFLHCEAMHVPTQIQELESHMTGVISVGMRKSIWTISFINLICILTTGDNWSITVSPRGLPRCHDFISRFNLSTPPYHDTFSSRDAMISSQDLICQHHVTTILSVLRSCGRLLHVPYIGDTYQESCAIIFYAIGAVEQTSHLGSFITYSNERSIVGNTVSHSLLAQLRSINQFKMGRPNWIVEQIKCHLRSHSNSWILMSTLGPVLSLVSEADF